MLIVVQNSNKSSTLVEKYNLVARCTVLVRLSCICIYVQSFEALNSPRTRCYSICHIQSINPPPQWQALHQQQVSNLYQSTYRELCRIDQLDVPSQLRLPKPLSHPWYCHVLTYCNYPTEQRFEKLRKVQNCSATLIFKTSKRTHASPLLTKLFFHVLRCSLRNCYALTDLLHLYIPFRSLRLSADTRTFRIPKRKKKFKGQHTFSHMVPLTWNKCPYSVHRAAAKPLFKILQFPTYHIIPLSPWTK